MNIIVKPYGNAVCHCRPDTTWERESRDFYSPECVDEIWWTPVLFARISKAGKCVGRRFVRRYYDGIGCGMLMYCRAMDNDYISCVDHTSVLPMPLYDPVILEEEKVFETMRSGKSHSAILSHERAGNMLEESICRASELISLRTGDFVAVELASPEFVASRKEGEVAVKGTFCENVTFDFNIIF